MKQETEDRESPIGIIDSGVGGLSFLRKACRVLPWENWIYYGDQGNAPYGKKSEVEIRKLVREGINWLIAERGVKAIVLACNTATAAAISEARRENPNLILIGMAPEIKTALRETLNDEKVLMLATEATCGSESYKNLKRDLDEEGKLIEVPSPELVTMVEEDVKREEYDEVLEKLIGRYADEKVGAIVLGCSHFIFAREIIENYVARKWKRGVKFYGGIDGTLESLKSQLRNANLLKPGNEEGEVELWTTGERERYLPMMEKLLRGESEREKK